MGEMLMQNHRTTAFQQSGIAQSLFESGDIRIEEVATASVLRLRSLQPAEKVAKSFQGVDIELPLAVNACAGADPRVLCLRRNDWLVLSEQQDPASIRARLLPALADGQTDLIDLSDGLAVMRLSGVAAPWLLAKFSALDFLAAADAGPHCARTRMGHAAVVVNHAAVNPAVFDLILDRSIVAYLWGLLVGEAGHANELSRLYGLGRS